MGKEEAEEFLASSYGAVVFAQLGESVWKARLEAADTVLNKVDSLGIEEVGVRTCMALALIPGWKDSNFQVLHCHHPPRTHIVAICNRVFQFACHASMTLARSCGSCVHRWSLVAIVGIGTSPGCCAGHLKDLSGLC